MLLDENVKAFLAHYGVQGMKWGKRKAYNKANIARLQGKGLTKRQAKATNQYQNAIDVQRQVAGKKQGEVSVPRRALNRIGSNSMLSPTTILKHPLSTQKAAALQLEKRKQTQKKVAEGKKKTTAMLLKLSGVKLSEIDFST